METTTADFQFVRQVVLDDCAVDLRDGKEYLVEAKLAPIARGERLGSVAELVGVLRRGAPGAPELRQRVVEAMVTGETHFFREPYAFEALRHEIIPEAVCANRGRHLRIWSAATSTGQEAYSAAMLLRDHFDFVPDVSVLATDISGRALERAATGRYSQFDVNRGLPASMLVRHFSREGKDWALHDGVRRLVTFRPLNLAKPLPTLPVMDIVMLRNVLIYFDQPTRQRVVDRVTQALRPGGFLVLGGAESLHDLTAPYERRRSGRLLYYRLRQNGANDASAHDPRD